MDMDGFQVPGDLRRVWDFSRDGVRRSLDESLRRLGTDHVEIVYAHDPDQFREGAAREALEALAQLRSQGVVRAIGVGTNAVDELADLLRDGLIDVVMLAGRYTLLEQGGLRTALDPALAAGAGIVAVGVFNSGLLSVEWPSSDAKYDYGQAPPDLIARARQIAAVCERHGTTLPDAAIAFPLLHPAVSSVAIGMRNAAQVDSNVARYERGVPQELWADLVESQLLDRRRAGSDWADCRTWLTTARGPVGDPRDQGARAVRPDRTTPGALRRLRSTTHQLTGRYLVHRLGPLRRRQWSDRPSGPIGFSRPWISIAKWLGTDAAACATGLVL